MNLAGIGRGVCVLVFTDGLIDRVRQGGLLECTHASKRAHAQREREGKERGVKDARDLSCKILNDVCVRARAFAVCTCAC